MVVEFISNIEDDVDIGRFTMENSISMVHTSSIIRWYDITMSKKNRIKFPNIIIYLQCMRMKSEMICKIEIMEFEYFLLS